MQDNAKILSALQFASIQLRRWHKKYGDNQPNWLPPSGELETMEMIDDAIKSIPQPAEPLIDERPVFEKWLVEIYMDNKLAPLDRCMSSGAYLRPFVQSAWRAWQARATLSKENAPPTEPTGTGTFECPICGIDHPHGHATDDIVRWLRAQASRFITNHTEIIEISYNSELRKQIEQLENRLRDINSTAHSDAVTYFYSKENNQHQQAQEVPVEPDAHCLTLANGDCISDNPKCMHNQSVEPTSDDLLRQAKRSAAAVDAWSEGKKSTLTSIDREPTVTLTDFDTFRTKAMAIISDKTGFDFSHQNLQEMNASDLFNIAEGIFEAAANNRSAVTLTKSELLNLLPKNQPASDRLQDDYFNNGWNVCKRNAEIAIDQLFVDKQM